MNIKRVGISAAIIAALLSATAELNPGKDKAARKDKAAPSRATIDGMPAKHNGGQKTGIAAAKRAAKKRRAMKARSPK